MPTISNWRPNKNRQPYKRPCYAKEACIRARPNYGNLLFPVCPVLQEILRDRPLYDMSEVPQTGLSLLDSVNRVRMVLGGLSKLQPNNETIVWCAHTKDSYDNRNFLTEWLKPISDDLKTLPAEMGKIFPDTSDRLAKLIKEFVVVVDSYTTYSRCNLYLLFPSYFGKDEYDFLVWRSQLTSSKPYGIVDYEGSNKEPDALVCASKAAMACTYPVDALMASRPICEELAEVSKFLDREKGGISRETQPASGKAEDTTQATLAPAIETAYQSCQDAIRKNPDFAGKKDKEVYTWLKDNGVDDYTLPAFETWQRYVREGRKHYDTSKNTPRAGRTGRSIITSQ